MLGWIWNEKLIFKVKFVVIFVNEIKYIFIIYGLIIKCISDLRFKEFYMVLFDLFNFCFLFLFLNI